MIRSSAGDVNYFDKLLIVTIAPFVLLAALVVLHVVALAKEGVLVHSIQRSFTQAALPEAEQQRKLVEKMTNLNSYFFQLFLMLSFLVFPSVSARVLRKRIRRVQWQLVVHAC